MRLFRCSLSGGVRNRSGVEAVVNCGEVRADDSIVLSLSPPVNES